MIQPAKTEAGLAIQELVYGGLEAIGSVMPLDFCAYCRRMWLPSAVDPARTRIAAAPL